MDARLIALGLSPTEAVRKAALFRETARALEHGGDDGLMQWFVPGRIEVLGKHTDYAGGRSLLCTVERGFCVTAIPRHDNLLTITDIVNHTSASFRVASDQPDETRWRNYPATVARRVARNFPASAFGGGSAAGSVDATTIASQPDLPRGELRGADVAFASDLPRAAGLSSSTAFLIAVFTVLAEVNRLDQHETYRREIPSIDALASYLGCIENGRTFGSLVGDAGVGTQGGSQDHAAILLSEPHHLVRYAYSPPHVEQSARLPDGVTFVVGASGVAAEKTGAARDQYNRASQMVTAILDLWRHATGRDDRTLFDVLEHSDNASDELRMVLAQSNYDRFSVDALLARVDQFIVEALEIVPAAAQAMARGDLREFGRLVDASQFAAEQWLDNQIPETMMLTRLARAHGAIAASAFGAGFGGSVWALVAREDAPRFMRQWSQTYLSQFPAHADRATFFVTTAGPPRVRV